MGKLLEIVLTRVDVIVETELQVMSEPPKADVLLLRRRGRQWTEAQRQLLPDGVRDRNAHHHLLECKFSESVNEAALQQALSYDYFYRRTQQLKVNELQTYLLSARTPRTALLTRFKYRQAEHPGVYITDQPLLEKVVLLVLNELRDAPHNEFLRLFASRQAVRQQTIAEVVRQPITDWPEAFWSLLFGLQRIYQLEETAMKREMTVEDVMAMGAELRRRAIVSAAPEELSDELRKQVIANAAPEDRLAGLAPEDRLAGLAPEDRLAGLAPEDRLAGLAPEEMAALLKQIESLLTQQAQVRPTHRKPPQR
jgi:hypothetical protein